MKELKYSILILKYLQNFIVIIVTFTKYRLSKYNGQQCKMAMKSEVRLYLKTTNAVTRPQKMRLDNYYVRT